MTRLVAALALGVGAATASCAAQSDPAPSAAPFGSAPEVPMVIEVADAATAAAALAAAQPLIHGADPTTDTVEILLPGGVLDGASLVLGSVYDARRLHIVVRGQGTTLRRSRLHLAGALVTVEDLVIDGGPSSGEALKLQAASAVRIVRVTIAGLTAPDRGPGTRTRSGVRIEALGPGAVASLDAVTVVENAGPLLQIAAQPGARFREVAVVGSRFAENDGPELVLGPVDNLRVEYSVRLGGEGPFARAESPRTLILSEPEARPADPALAAAWRRAAPDAAP